MSFNSLQYVIPSCEHAFWYYVSQFNQSPTLVCWVFFHYLGKIQVFKWAVSFFKWQGPLGMSVEPRYCLWAGQPFFAEADKVARNSFFCALVLQN